jgi:hypothetical protein
VGREREIDLRMRLRAGLPQKNISPREDISAVDEGQRQRPLSDANLICRLLGGGSLSRTGPVAINLLINRIDCSKSLPPPRGLCRFPCACVAQYSTYYTQYSRSLTKTISCVDPAIVSESDRANENAKQYEELLCPFAASFAYYVRSHVP